MIFYDYQAVIDIRDAFFSGDQTGYQELKRAHQRGEVQDSASIAIIDECEDFANQNEINLPVCS